MSSGLMSLAYLAEISVVFNLAFGEFKSEEFAKDIQDLFEKIDKSHPDGFTFAQEVESRAKSDPELIDANPTEIFAAVKTLDHVRKVQGGKFEDGAKYNPLLGFIDRIKVFSVNPLRKGKRGWPQMMLAVLPSWVYSKTEMWKYKFCWTSLVLWSFIALLCGYFGAINESPRYRLAEDVVLIWMGIGFIVFLPRPMTEIISRLLNTRPLAPRARYYSFILTGASTIALFWLIWTDHMSSIQAPITSSIPSLIMEPNRWYFMWGFLIASVVSPFLMLVGHLMLRANLRDWYIWLEGRAKSAGTSAVADLNGQVTR